jgi:hypothetical protein
MYPFLDVLRCRVLCLDFAHGNEANGIHVKAAISGSFEKNEKNRKNF